MKVKLIIDHSLSITIFGTTDMVREAIIHIKKKYGDVEEMDEGLSYPEKN